jgi:hypothetical protein
MADGPAPLCRYSYFGCQAKRDDDKRLFSIRLDHQHVSAMKPIVEPRKAISAAFYLKPPINTEQRHRYVATEPSSRGTAQRYPLGCEAVVPQPGDQCPLNTIAFLA